MDAQFFINKYIEEIQELFLAYEIDEPVTAETIYLAAQEFGEPFAQDLLQVIEYDLYAGLFGRREARKAAEAETITDEGGGEDYGDQRTPGQKAESAFQIIGSLFGSVAGIVGAAKAGKNNSGGGTQQAGFDPYRYGAPADSERDKKMLYLGIGGAVLVIVLLIVVVMNKK